MLVLLALDVLQLLLATIVYLETMADFGVAAVGTSLCSCYILLLLKLWLMMQVVQQHGLQVVRRFVAKGCISWCCSQCDSSCVVRGVATCVSGILTPDVAALKLTVHVL